MSNKLHFMCGKMAAGKSTLSRKLTSEYNAILLSEDELLKKRNENFLEDTPLIDESTFDAITKYFQEPKEDENCIKPYAKYIFSTPF